MSVKKEDENMSILNGILDNSKMSRIIIHWTAGTWSVNSLDKEHYHIIIDGDGIVHKGDRAIKDNEIISGTNYAAHTKGTNTGSIGVSLCGMAGATESNFGKFPIKKEQLDVLISVLKELKKHYKIPVTDRTILSHAEVQTNLGIRQNGKWDISVFPWDANNYNTAKKCGDFIREKVNGN